MTTSKQKIEDAKAIRTTKDKINFILKYCPELNLDRDCLELCIKFLEDYSLANGDLKKSYDQMNRPDYFFESKNELLKEIKKLENIKKKIKKPEFDIPQITNFFHATNELIKLYKVSASKSHRGNKRSYYLFLFCNRLASSWKHYFDHEKFIYDDGNRHPDLANNFVDTYVMADTGKEVSQIPRLRETLKKESDHRKKTKKPIIKDENDFPNSDTLIIEEVIKKKIEGQKKSIKRRRKK